MLGNMEAHDQDSGCATLVADTRHVGMRLDTDMGISDCRKFLDLEDMYHHDPIKTTATGGGCRRHRRLRLSLPGVELPKRCCEHSAQSQLTHGLLPPGQREARLVNRTRRIETQIP